MVINIKYHDKDLERIEKLPQGNWIDLRCAKDVHLNAGDFVIIPLGVSMEIPEGYEAHLLPRSSTFKKYGILQTNSMGIIDTSYSGDGDIWGMPVYAIREADIKKNERICQFRFVETMEKMEHPSFKEVEHLNSTNRGGFGSTGSL